VSPTVVCLDVNVLEGQNLPPGGSGAPSPYLKVTLRPDPEDHRLRKTEPLKKTASPVFKENFKYYLFVVYAWCQHSTDCSLLAWLTRMSIMMDVCPLKFGTRTP
jgi:hypothetical protein